MYKGQTVDYNVKHKAHIFMFLIKLKVNISLKEVTLGLHIKGKNDDYYLRSW